MKNKTKPKLPSNSDLEDMFNSNFSNDFYVSSHQLKHSDNLHCEESKDAFTEEPDSTFNFQDYFDMKNESKYDEIEVESDEESCSIIIQNISVKHHDKQCRRVIDGGFGKVVGRK